MLYPCPAIILPKAEAHGRLRYLAVGLGSVYQQARFLCGDAPY